MKKISTEQNKKNELWFNWLTRKINSYEAFKDFASGNNPEDVAENFISINRIEILEIFEKFDKEDIDILNQFQNLTECEWHVFRILKNRLGLRDNVKFVDFRKERN